MRAAHPGDVAGRTIAVKHVFPPVVQAAIVGTFLILFLGALYYARDFVLPLVLACLLTITLSPLVGRLARLGVPAAVSALLLVGGVGVGVGAAAVFFSGPIAQVASQMPDTVSTVRERLAFLKRPITTLNNAGHDVESVLNGADEKAAATTTVIVSNGGGLVSWLLGTVADLGTTFAATLLLAVFLLAANDGLRRKLIRVLPELSGKKRSLRVLHEIENDVSRYLVTVTAINAGLGVLVGCAMAVVGLGNGIVWGVAAGLLNFIPYVGATVGIFLVAGTSLATFTGLAAAATPPLIYLGLQILEGSFVTPMILGRRLSLSPIAILTVLSLTTWMWGIVGTVIGVPLLVVFKVFCDQFPSLAGIGVFLSSESSEVEEAGRDETVPAGGGATEKPRARGQPRGDAAARRRRGFGRRRAHHCCPVVSLTFWTKPGTAAVSTGLGP